MHQVERLAVRPGAPAAPTDPVAFGFPPPPTDNDASALLPEGPIAAPFAQVSGALPPPASPAPTAAPVAEPGPIATPAPVLDTTGATLLAPLPVLSTTIEIAPNSNVSVEAPVVVTASPASTVVMTDAAPKVEEAKPQTTAASIPPQPG